MARERRRSASLETADLNPKLPGYRGTTTATYRTVRCTGLGKRVSPVSRDSSSCPVLRQPYCARAQQLTEWQRVRQLSADILLRVQVQPLARYRCHILHPASKRLADLHVQYGVAQESASRATATFIRSYLLCCAYRSA